VFIGASVLTYAYAVASNLLEKFAFIAY